MNTTNVQGEVKALDSTEFSLPLPATNLSSRFFQILRYLGPAFIVSVAYIDPGNFATNISGGSNFNYNLIWVVLWSNLMAIFLQTLSAKLGIATGMDLPTSCSRYFSRSTNWGLWIVAELAAMATDLAEFLGAALGFYLLFHLPMIKATLLTGLITMGIVSLERFGQRVVEYVIIALVAAITGAYVLELFLAHPNWGQVGYHTLVPSIDRSSILVAVGMLGATVMPHVIYLHSQLVQVRRGPVHPAKLKQTLRLEKIDIWVAMNIAFIVNAAMVIVAAAVFYSKGIKVTTIQQADHSLAPLLGPLSSAAFGVALLASGLSSSAVGTLAGQAIMRGFIGLRIPILLRRLITMLPAIAFIAIGYNPMQVLIMSQVVLSFALPFAIIPLLLLTGRGKVMGALVNRLPTKVAGWLINTVIIGLNVILVYLTLRPAN